MKKTAVSAHVSRAFAPAVYSEGEGVLNRLAVEGFAGGARAVFIVEKTLLEKYAGEFGSILKLGAKVVYFGGECSFEEVERLEKASRASSLGRNIVVFAAGGGKALDTSKILSQRLGARLAAIPTSTATCAAFTSIVPTYFSDGRKRKTLGMERSADLCLADYKILIRQPRRLMTAGIADAVAKYYETAAYVRANPSALDDASIRVAAAISVEILRLARECASGALAAIDRGEITRDFRRAIYLTLLMPGMVSGLGGKKCRAVAAHALANGLTHAVSARGALHGEHVGWGILVQLILEGKKKEARELKSFFDGIGAPTTLAALGLRDLDSEGLKKALAAAASPEESMRFLGRKIGVRELSRAVRTVERME
ncbi:MAG: iron-containing alcohol dehydrogenase [Endomicrobiia bacterium]|nr:iron-containing alcohol dehydrogenase [Endomicrobiia bacterium]